MMQPFFLLAHKEIRAALIESFNTPMRMAASEMIQAFDTFHAATRHSQERTMRQPFPHKLQYAMNLTNGSQEAVDRINAWAERNGGSVENKSIEQIRAEVVPLLHKPRE